MGDPPLDLAHAYAELQDLILDTPDVVDFLHELARLAAEIVPGTHCGVTLRRDRQITTAASSDDFAARLDEVQYLHRKGPCLEALESATCVEVPDTAVETRWDDYGPYAVANGVGSILAVPISVDGASIGAVNLFAPEPRAFAEPEVGRAQAFARQAGTALTILLRQASTRALDEQLRDALATRAVIDQALGILMYTHRISASEAFEVLREASQTNNRKVSAMAAELVERMTGHAPEPPRPLSQRH